MRTTDGALLLAVATLLSCAPSELQELENEINGWVENGDIVGAELLVLRDGETLKHEAFGWKDREARTPLEVNSIYSLASLTKPVTALAILVLAEEGALSLDDPVSRYIPSFGGDPRVTIADLLAQRSGDGGEHGDGGYNVYDFATLADWVLDWADGEATAEYGQFSYSNFNYAALGYIAEEASGVPFGDFVTDRILQPLGMNDTYVSFAPDSAWASRVPTSYVWDADTRGYEVFWTARQPQRWAFFPAAFGLWGTALDFARFVAMWMEDGSGPRAPLVSEQMLEAALAPQGLVGNDPVYGFGWFLGRARTAAGDPDSFRHSGGRGTLAIGYPEDRGIVIYFTQSENPANPQGVLANRIEMSGLFRYPGPDMPWADGADLEGASLRAAESEEVVGLYGGSVPWLVNVDWSARIWAAGGVLHFEEGERGSLLQSRVHLVPVGEDLFARGRYEKGRLVAVDPETRLRVLRVGDRVSALELSVDGTVESVWDRIGEGVP